MEKLLNYLQVSFFAGGGFFALVLIMAAIFRKQVKRAAKRYRNRRKAKAALNQMPVAWKGRTL